ncbi:MAG: tryptophan 7-halogenase [Sphingomonadales bacterium]|jgi:tryptophan halogenase|nr:tryptophan 7-halogenase [Sphingomonadales bacterium]
MAAGSDRAIRRITIVGGGIVGLSAATAFARALPGVRVELVDTAPDPGALCDRLPGTLPTANRFHAALGVDEIDLVRRGIATHRLGLRFESWSVAGKPWHFVHGETGFSLGAASFHDLWLLARQAKGALPYDSYAPAAALAKAGKFVHPESRPNTLLSTFLYGLRLDPEGYGEHLRRSAVAAGVILASGAVHAIERREDGGVAALLLADRRVEGDLYIDCAGPAAPLASAMGKGFDDWSAYLPCDRVVLTAERGSGTLSTAETVTALASGWRWSAPLREGQLAGFSFAAGTGVPSGAEGEPVAIRPGRRPEPWIRNVLALGDAACTVDPLHWTGLHLAHSAVLRALELLPGRDCHPLELREYNRRTALETDRVRDFLALHYLRSGRRAGAFWRALVDRPLPDSLAWTIEQFKARGRIPFHEEETFDKAAWAAALIGLGIVPRHVNPAAAAASATETVAALASLSEQIEALPRRLPSYAEYLVRMTSLPASSPTLV